MPRLPITCVFPTGECFYCSHAEAAEIVRNGEGEWDGERRIRMKHHDRAGGRLSLRVGRPLTEAVHRNESWAHVALREINR